MPFPVTINGNTYTEAMFSPYGYVTNFPAILNDLASVAAAIALAASSGATFANNVTIGLNDAKLTIVDTTSYASGVGGIINLDFMNASAAQKTGARMETRATTGTASSEVADWWLGTMRSGTLTDAVKVTGAGQLAVQTNITSTSTTTGSLVNPGGFGNAGAAFFGSTVSIAGAALSTAILSLNFDSSATPAFIIQTSNASVAGELIRFHSSAGSNIGGINYTASQVGLTASGLWAFSNTTDASAIGTASVVLSGGLSVEKQLRVGTDVTLSASAAVLTIGTTEGAKLRVGRTSAIGGTGAAGLFEFHSGGATANGIQVNDQNTANNATYAAFFANGTLAGSFLHRTGATGFSIQAEGILGLRAGGSTDAIVISTAQIVSIPNTTASTSTTTGALTVAGGLGVAGAGYFGGNVSIETSNAGGIGGALILDNPGASTLNSGTAIAFLNEGGASYAGVANARIKSLITNASSGSSNLQFLTYNGASEGVRFAISAAGIIDVINDTDASAIGTASAVMAGGLSVAKKGYFGDEVHVDRTSGNASFFMNSSATGASYVSYKRNGTEKWELGTGVGGDSDNLRLYTPGGGVLIEWFQTTGGVVHGGATGGDKGAGTINAKAVYDDNTLLTDYVFDKYLKIGKLDTYSTRVREKFDALDSVMFGVHAYVDYWRKNQRLYGMPELNDCIDGVIKDVSLGGMCQLLTQTAELHAIHIGTLADNDARQDQSIESLTRELSALRQENAELRQSRLN